MCGIAGIWDFNNSTSRNILIQEVSAMADRLKSRGPDSSGYWVDEEKGIAFSHRRLAIQDLSRNGNQPFFSKSGKLEKLVLNKWTLGVFKNCFWPYLMAV